jgi:hypothetical protein
MDYNNVSIENLLELDIRQRDEAWGQAFMRALPNARVKVASPEAIQGPDGWPYIMVETGPEADDQLTNVLAWLSTRGIGLVLNPSKGMPDLALTWGMIWNYRERGEFMTQVPGVEMGKKPSRGRFELKDGQKVMAGPPSESYLPGYVRTVIKQFLLDQGIFAPKVLMVSVDEMNYDLCFSIESLKSPPAHEHANIAEALAWFLPAHYSVSLLSEKTVAGFAPL